MPRRHKPPAMVLTVTPAIVPLNSTSITISGSGFVAGATIWLDTGYIPEPTAVADASGAFSLSYNHTFSMPKQGSIDAYDSADTNMTVKLATALYTVA